MHLVKIFIKMTLLKITSYNKKNNDGLDNRGGDQHLSLTRGHQCMIWGCLILKSGSIHDYSSHIKYGICKEGGLAVRWDALM